MRYPNSLPQNGTIGCIAPSFGCNIEPYRSAFENAQKTWKEMGYKILTGPNCYEGSGIGISNTPELCAAEVNHFFAEEDCDVILSCGGGELMCEVVSHIDFERIARAKAKWFMGFSDNTNLTFLLPTLCDMAAIYGPCAPAFGMREWHPALNDAWGILTGEKGRCRVILCGRRNRRRTRSIRWSRITSQRRRRLWCGRKERVQLSWRSLP